MIVLSGRRIDAPNAPESRFPLMNINRVQKELKELFVRLAADTLVCSAACGADLLALQAAGEVGLRRRVVLPFAASRFRRTSVVDRPGPWGVLFDKITMEVEAEAELIVLPGKTDDEKSYAAANAQLMSQAEQIATNHEGGSFGCAAAVVWEGAPRAGQDFTAQFRSLAQERGWPVYEVSTL